MLLGAALHAAHLTRVARHGLFAQNVLACREHPNGLFAVRIVGAGNIDRLKFRAGGQFVQRGEGVFCALRGGEFLRALLGAGIDGDELKILDQTPGRDEFFYNRAGTDDGKFHSESPSFLALQRRMNHCQMGSIPSSSRRSGCHWVASTRSPYS